jgi:hypothetical protein
MEKHNRTLLRACGLGEAGVLFFSFSFIFFNFLFFFRTDLLFFEPLPFCFFLSSAVFWLIFHLLASKGGYAPRDEETVLGGGNLHWRWRSGIQGGIERME